MKDLLKKAKNIGDEAADILKAAQAAILTKHTIGKDETLSDIALKHYGHATEKYWKLIYTFNKATIGDDPNKLSPGMEINIPKLPDTLK